MKLYLDQTQENWKHSQTCHHWSQRKRITSIPRNYLSKFSPVICSKWCPAEWPWALWVWWVVQKKTKAIHVGFNKFNRLSTATWPYALYTLYDWYFSWYYIMTTSLTTAVDDWCSSSSVLHMTGSLVLSLTSYCICYFICSPIICDWLVIPKLCPLGVLDTWPWISIH